MTGDEGLALEHSTRPFERHTVGDGLDLGGGPHWLIGGETTLGIHQVRGKDGVDEGGLSETRLAWRWTVSPAPNAMMIHRRNLPTHMTLNWKPRLSSFRSIWEVMLSKPTWLRGKTVEGGEVVVAAIGWMDKCR